MRYQLSFGFVLMGIILGIALAVVGLMMSIPTIPVNAALLPRGTPSPAVTASPDILVEQGRLLFRAQRLSAALNAVNVVIERHRLNPVDDVSLFRAYFLRGQIIQMRGTHAQAVDDFTQAIQLQPEIAEVYRFRAESYRHMEEYEAALADFATAIAYDTGEPAHYRARGRVYLHLENYTAAIEDFSQAITLDPEDAASYRDRGFAWLGQDEGAAALADFTRYLALMTNAADRAEIEAIITELESN